MKRPVSELIVTLSSAVMLLIVIWPADSQQAALANSGDSAFDGSLKEGLVGYWKLRGDCRDYSGFGNHGQNHGVKLNSGAFDGRSAYIEVPNSDSLKLGARDFSLCAWVYTEKEVDDIVGDIFYMYDPALRRGITLSIDSSGGGYQAQGTDRHIHFGIDNARLSDWIDCGRPNPQSNYVSNSLTVYNGSLYAASAGAADPKDWCHVYRYDGGEKWVDCGRVGEGRTTGVMPLTVHDGRLYAATGTIDWTRVGSGDYDAGSVYRYVGGTQWDDCGQPSDNRTLTSLASYRGKLYCASGPTSPGIFVLSGTREWTPSKMFMKNDPHRLFPHSMCRYDGRLYAAFPGAFAFDGRDWTFVGDPVPFVKKSPSLQTHSMTIYEGKLHAGTWPDAVVSVYEGGEHWRESGRVGVDGTEVNSLAVYNGKLYGGSLPRAEVCRFDGDSKWTSLKRFSPDNWGPVPADRACGAQVKEWCRATSLTVFDGKLFVSTGSCTSSVLDAPLDLRGKVFSMEAGKVASFDRDLGSGWKHVSAVRNNGRLKLFVDGQLVAESAQFDPGEYDVSTDRPLRIGFGQTDNFAGKMSDVHVYSRALREAEIQELSDNAPE